MKKNHPAIIFVQKHTLPSIIIILLIFFIVKCISVVLTTPLSFDGAMNAQTVQNIANNGRYASSYNGITDFDARIQTGLPVLLPAAIIMKLFGATSTSLQVINAIYMIALAIAIMYYLRYCIKVDDQYIILALLLLIYTPNIFSLGFGLLGEIPALFFIVLSLIFLNRINNNERNSYFFGAGFSLGVGLLTKTVVLIVFPAVIYSFALIFLFCKRYSLLETIRRAFILITGLLLPVAAFEIYRLAVLGWDSYISWWRIQINGITAQAGLTKVFMDTPGIMDKFIIHLEKYESFSGISPILLSLILFILLVLFIGILIQCIRHVKNKKKVITTSGLPYFVDFQILLTLTLSYFGWWLLITPTEKAWGRRIINGSILLELLVVILLYLGFTFVFHQLKNKTSLNKRNLYQILTCVFCFLPLINIMQSDIHRISFKDTPLKQAYIEAADFVKNLPNDSEFFGYDWWQAPVLAFESGKTFANINQRDDMELVGPKDDKFLVIDPSVGEANNQEYRIILGLFDHRLVYSKSDIQIYQLLYKYPYVPFTSSERERVNYSSIDFTTNDRDYISRNVYFSEDNPSGKWAQKYSGYLLEYKGEDSLEIIWKVTNIYGYDSCPVFVNISINQSPTFTYSFEKNGDYRIDVPLNDLQDGVIEVMLTTSAKLDAPNDTRSLGLFLTWMGLVNQ